MNNVVHTGKKIQSGGLNAGLFIVVYHVPIEGVVNNDPRKPTANGIKMDIASFIRFIFIATPNFVPCTTPLK